MDPVLIVFLIVIAAGIGWTFWSRSRYATVTLGFDLRNGEKYAEALDTLVSRSDFNSADARASVLNRIGALILEEDLVDAFVDVRSPWSGKDQAGVQAEAISRKHMEYFGITPEVVNVAMPGASEIKLAPRGSGGLAETADACVLAVMATVNRRFLDAFVYGGLNETIETLRRLRNFPGAGLDALYVYYTPNAGEPMDAVTANGIFLDLKATET